MVQSSQGQAIKVKGQVKFKFALIGLKLGENKHGYEGSIKHVLRIRLVKVIQGQRWVKFQLIPNLMKTLLHLLKRSITDIKIKITEGHLKPKLKSSLKIVQTGSK